MSFESARIEIAIGVGCRSACEGPVIEALVRATLARAPRAKRLGLFTLCDKEGEAGLAEAANALALPLVFLSREALRAQAARVVTPSVQAQRLFGVPGVAEAAALAGAGAGSVLIVPRRARAGATCAIARSAEGAR